MILVDAESMTSAASIFNSLFTSASKNATRSGKLKMN